MPESQTDETLSLGCVPQIAKPRGRPFVRGNPGRPKGSRHKATVLAEQLLMADIEEIVQTVKEKAKAGDMAAARIILDRVAPIRKGRAVKFQLPKITNLTELAAAFATVVSDVSLGILTPEEGEIISKILESHRSFIECAEIDRRLTALEDNLKRMASR